MMKKRRRYFFMLLSLAIITPIFLKDTLLVLFFIYGHILLVLVFENFYQNISKEQDDEHDKKSTHVLIKLLLVKRLHGFLVIRPQLLEILMPVDLPGRGCGIVYVEFVAHGSLITNNTNITNSLIYITAIIILRT